jgi:hypothetical protein
MESEFVKLLGKSSLYLDIVQTYWIFDMQVVVRILPLRRQLQEVVRDFKAPWSINRLAFTLRRFAVPAEPSDNTIKQRTEET